MKILPSEYLDENNPAQSSDEFIGSARHAAVSIENIVRSSLPRKSVIKILLSGEPGVGKTALSIFTCALLKTNIKWGVRQYSGVDMKIDVVRDIASSLCLSNDELFGPYRIFIINEVDQIPQEAQVRWLDLMDKLPKGTAIIGTCNSKVNDLEKRFQTRFKALPVFAPSVEEIKGLIQKWDVPESVANGIAITANGCVRVAMLEAEEWLQNNHFEKAA